MKTLIILGSGEFTPHMSQIDTDLALVNAQVKPVKIGIIPTAADDIEDCKRWINKGTKHFNELNIESMGIPLFEQKNANDSKIIKLLDDTSWMYFSGGSPTKLMTTISNSKFLESVLECYQKGVYLCGSSAGAMIMGSQIPTHFNFSINKPIEYSKGLDLLPYTIIPHFDMIRKFSIGLIDILINSKNNWLCIDENTAIIIEDNHNAMVKGKGQVHVVKRDEKKVYRSGDSFILNP